MRPLCPVCNSRPVAINCYNGNKIYYRKVCDHCSRKGLRAKQKPPEWSRSGYKKKPACEKCGFKFKLPEQSNVFYVDGNLKNNNEFNLKTICLNCTQEVYKTRVSWKPAPIVPDF